MSVIVFCPGELVTGGTEALHQLADAINRVEPHRATMIYWPFRTQYQVPAAFRRYNIDVAGTTSAADLAGATVILPETAAGVINVLGAAKEIHMWWLSVDKFFAMAGRESEALLGTAARRITKHLYQSEYARQFVEPMPGESAPLGDYLAEEYRRAASQRTATRRDNIVVYNPAKGAARTEKILAAMPGVEAVPITGMSRKQVRRLLGRAKVYIDFGEHPGKDRIPREAAACGTCVLVNQRGAAGNDIDYLIEDEYKIDDTSPGFEWEAAAKIGGLLIDYEYHQPRFELWRKTIATEDIEFRRDVQASYATT